MALCLPVLLGQDCLRYHAFAREAPRDAAVMDASWLVCQIVLFALFELLATGTSSSGITLAWAGALLPGALWISVRERLWPALRRARSFWRAVKHDALRLLADSAIATIATQALPVVVAAAAGLAAAGALRGGLTMMGVINIVVAGLTPVATMSVRREHDRTGRVTRFLWEWNATVLLISALNGVLIWALPENWGRAALGGTWVGASLLLLPLVMQSMIRGPITGVPVALRATDRVGEALRLRIWTTIPALVFPWGGALVNGASGAAWGIFISAVVGNVICVSWLRRSLAPPVAARHLS
jgi:O-antigen/teichoic acid export membrane protein